MRTVDWSKNYLCIGENFGRCKIGDCGKSKPLLDWVSYLSGKDNAFCMDYFKYWDTKEILEYVYVNFGKRIKRV